MMKFMDIPVARGNTEMLLAFVQGTTVCKGNVFFSSLIISRADNRYICFGVVS